MQKKYDFKQAEREMQQFWKEHQVYRFDEDGHKEVFSIDTPPPTVSGSLHIGHIFSYTQAEMIARFKRMQGYNVFYPFGFDDNGLPTERLVEREEKIRAKDMARNEFIAKCMKTTRQYEEEFKDLWQSLGFSVDWSLQYETISPQAQRISQRSFLHLLAEEKAYMKKSPVLWCTDCRTSIAQAELDTVEKETTFNYIPFMADGEKLIVATTRPELLYGCVSLFVHPGDKRYKKYIGKEAIVPLYDYLIPILADEKVSQEKGTGVVMCATFGDTADVEWVEKYKLPYRKVIQPDNTIEENVPFIGGLQVRRARDVILHILSAKGLLNDSQTIEHTVGVHERCGKEIEILSSKQWYIDILSNKDRFLRAADEINWYPAYMKNRYILWVENLKWDWCISRQRYFGVPIPVWYCRECGRVIPADEDSLPVNPLDTKPDQVCPCGSSEFIPENAVLDTWATSSLTPQINAKWEEKEDRSEWLLPMSMRTQAHEIIRTWAFYTIVKSLYHTGLPPWRDIMICGFVLAKKGEKISKSKSNTGISPAALTERHSADVIRYWAANAKLGTDTYFSEDELRIAKRFMTKLWNAARFVTSHLYDLDLAAEIHLLPPDRWIQERCRQTTRKAVMLLNHYEIGAARHEIDDLFWNDFCDYYLEIVKDRLYKPEIHGAKERQAAQHTLYYCLLNILKLYAVYVPHITEYIYQNLPGKKDDNMSLHQTCWENPSYIDEELIQFGEQLKDAVAKTRKYKSEHAMSMKTEINEVIIECDARFHEMFIQTVPDIKACCKAKDVRMSMSDD